MPFDYNSFLQGVQTGLRLGRTKLGRQPPVPSGRYILTESGIPVIMERTPDGYPIGKASSVVGCDWELPLTLYQNAYRTFGQNTWRYVANDGCVMLVRLSTANTFRFAIASDTPGEVGTIYHTDYSTVLETYRSYILNGKTVHYYIGNASFEVSASVYAPDVPDDEGEVDARACWIAVYGDITLNAEKMITEGT